MRGACWSPLGNSHGTGCRAHCVITGEAGRAALWAWLDSRVWEAIEQVGSAESPGRLLCLPFGLFRDIEAAGSRSRALWSLNVLAASLGPVPAAWLGKQLRTSLYSLST